MEALDYWRLCEELTIVQASLLIAGQDPSGVAKWIEDHEPDKRPIGYEAAKCAVSVGLQSGTIKGTIRQLEDTDFNGCLYLVDGSFNVQTSTVEVESLKVWLRSRGITTGFFFPSGSELPEYLDPSHPRYAPKLAAAVMAWQAVTDTGKTSPKKALDKWLRENAARFGMTDDDGNLMNTPIEECSKVANWNTSGGAPKTG